MLHRSWCQCQQSDLQKELDIGVGSFQNSSPLQHRLAGVPKIRQCCLRQGIGLEPRQFDPGPRARRDHTSARLRASTPAEVSPSFGSRASRTSRPDSAVINPAANPENCVANYVSVLGSILRGKGPVPQRLPDRASPSGRLAIPGFEPRTSSMGAEAGRSLAPRPAG